MGTVADFPGTLWGVHGMSTDQEGNLYVAEVGAGRFQKFRARRCEPGLPDRQAGLIGVRTVIRRRFDLSVNDWSPLQGHQ
jgi:hypothetical protein